MNARIAGLLAASLILTAGAQALALDAYRDRRGLFGGLLVGAGSGQTDIKGDDSHIGYNIRGRIGGGVSQNLTLDAELGFHFQSYTLGKQDVSVTQFTTAVGANFFVYDGLYVRGMGGIANIGSEVSGNARGGLNDDTGLLVGAGAGYEFFANGDLAVGVGFDYQLAMYEDVDFRTINFGVSATWY